MNSLVDGDTDEATFPDRFEVSPSSRTGTENEEEMDHVPLQPPPTPQLKQVSLSPSSPAAHLPLHVTPALLQSPRFRTFDIFEEPPSAPPPTELSLLSSSLEEPEEEGLGMNMLSSSFEHSSPRFNDWPSFSQPGTPAHDPRFKLPSTPASEQRRRREHDDRATSGRTMERPGTPTPNSANAVAPLGIYDAWPESAPDSISSTPSSNESSSMPSSLSWSSPSYKERAVNARKRMPWLSIKHPGRGVTGYGAVPVDRSIEVDDDSYLYRTKRERAQAEAEGDRLVVEGSTNGHYLQERKEFEEWANDVVESDVNTKLLYREYLVKTVHMRRRDYRNS